MVVRCATTKIDGRRDVRRVIHSQSTALHTCAPADPQVFPSDIHRSRPRFRRRQRTRVGAGSGSTISVEHTEPQERLWRLHRALAQLVSAARGHTDDKTWSGEWAKWREAAGWPVEHGTFHALRHFFATTLITNHVEPQEVQRLLRHKTLRITLETYVRWWPKRDRRRGVVGAVLSAAGTTSTQSP